MGLSITLNGESIAQWAYSGFASFRQKLAEEAGLVLNDMEGFHHAKYEGSADVLIAAIKAEGPKKSWDTVKDPIKYLLHHSDSDGKITPKRCKLIAPRLRELVKDWPDKYDVEVPDHPALAHYPKNMEFPNHDKVNALSLADGMDEAARLNLPVEFH